MNENQEVSRKLPAKSGSKGRKRVRCTVEVKMKAVKLHLEEGYGQAMPCGEMGIGASTLAKWVREYRARGEEGLRALPPPGGRQGSVLVVAEGVFNCRWTVGLLLCSARVHFFKENSYSQMCLSKSEVRVN